MKDKIFLHNILFRIFTPPVFGALIYILILLIFDSLDQLINNFFSNEVLLIIILTYVLFLCMRQVIVILEKKCPIETKIRNRILIQLFINGLLSIVITTGIISFYFIFFLGYSSFSEELIIFNLVFLITSIFYNMLYFSIFFLFQKNEMVIEKERIFYDNVSGK